MKQICHKCRATIVEGIENNNFFYECPGCGERWYGLVEQVYGVLNKDFRG